MATIGKLKVLIDADSSGLKTGLNSASGEVNAFSSRMDSVIGKLKVITPLAAAVGAAFAVNMVRSVANTADALAKLSQKTGVAVEDLSRLQYAAGLSGVSNDQLSAGITRLSKGMVEAAAGTGEAGKAFDAMGVTVKNADGTLRAQSDVMADLADKFAGYKDGAEKSALAQQIFGRAGANLIPMLNAGAKGLKDMADESDHLGNTIDTKTAKAAERFNDNITRLQTGLGGMARTIAGPVIQSLADLTSSMFDAFKQGQGLLGVLDAIAKSNVGKRANIDDAANDVKRLWQEYSKLADKAQGQDVGTQAVNAAEMAYSKYMDAMRNYSTLLDAQIKSEEKLNQVRSAPVVTMDAPTATKVVGGRGARTPEEPEGVILDHSDPDDPVQKMLEARAEAWRESEAKAADAQEEAAREGFARRVEALREYIKTEEQLTLDRHAKQLDDLILGRENGLLTEQEYMLAEQDIAMKHMEELARIRGDGMKRIEDITMQSWDAQLGAVVAKMGEMTAAAAAGSRAMFNINKVAAIANALLKAKESITSAYAFGSKIGGPPLGAAMAGVAAAATAGQIAAIKSQSFSGGGASAGVSSGGASAVAPSQSAAAGGGQTITIQGVSTGDLFSGDAVRTLIDKLIDAQRNGARIVLA